MGATGTRGRPAPVGPSRGISWGAPAARRLAAATASVLAASLLAGGALPAAAAGYDPARDVNSMFMTTKYLGVHDWWNAGYTGKGIDVAVIDTGVSPVAGLDGPDKVLYGPDLSLESQAGNLTHYDTNGHGTFMAGLIAGRDAGINGAWSDPSYYRGMAPGARIVSIKVGVADGGVDVSQVIAAIAWVIQHRNDNGLNIRVLSLSYGTNSLQLPKYDPLAFAVEAAWRHGIVVVAAAGNTGYQRGRGAPGMANPAFTPWILSVGASDSMYTLTQKDDTVAPYSASGNGLKGYKNPDIVAPGAHLQGLRVENGFLDKRHPGSAFGARFFRGSGTSEAAAIVSGAVALLLDRWPAATPDMVKKFLRDNAFKLTGFDERAQGKGELRLLGLLNKKPANATQSWARSVATGSLEASRGKDHLTRDAVLLRGEMDIFGRAWTAALAAQVAAGTSWSGGTWNGNTWSGNTWSGDTWSGDTWSGNSWSGNSWSGEAWSGNTWSGNSWSGEAWAGGSWSGNSWTGGSWAGGAWE
jgi:serine protease AprX